MTPLGKTAYLLSVVATCALVFVAVRSSGIGRHSPKGGAPPTLSTFSPSPASSAASTAGRPSSPSADPSIAVCDLWIGEVSSPPSVSTLYTPRAPGDTATPESVTSNDFLGTWIAHTGALYITDQFKVLVIIASGGTSCQYSGLWIRSADSPHRVQSHRSPHRLV